MIRFVGQHFNPDKDVEKLPRFFLRIWERQTHIFNIPSSEIIECCPYVQERG